MTNLVLIAEHLHALSTYRIPGLEEDGGNHTDDRKHNDLRCSVTPGKDIGFLSLIGARDQTGKNVCHGTA